MPNDYWGTIPAAIRYNKNLTPIDKLIYCDITARSNSKGYCWPSNKTIAEDLNLKPRIVSLAISKLVKEGYLIREDRPELTTHRALHPSTAMLPPSTAMLPPTHGGATPPSMVVLPKDNKLSNTNKNTNMAKESKKNFDLFWNAYPRKKKKKDAEKAFNKSTSLPPIEEHIKIIEAWKVTDQWTKDNGTYIPYPTTWLNGELWNDELPSKQINKYEGIKTYGRCDKCGKENNLINNVCIDCIKEQNNVA